MKRQWRQSLAIATVLLGHPIIAYAEDPTPIRFVLDWQFEGEHAQFTVPLDDGTFKRDNLAVAIDRGNGSGDTVTKVASGAYDLGLADFYVMLRFNAANPDRRLIAVAMVQDKSALGVIGKGGIKTPADFAGKRVAGPVNDAGRALFPLFASANHLDASSIQWLNVSPDLRETMLARGQADAATGNFSTLLMNLRTLQIPDADLVAFPYVNYGIQLYGSVLVAKPDFAARHADAIRRFVRGIVHGLNVMIADPNAAMASLKSHDSLLIDAVEKQRMRVSLQYSLIDDHVLQNGFSDVDPARMAKTLEEVSPIFSLSPSPTVAQSYTDQYLPPRQEMKILPWRPAEP
jgi:NitT/TauT family transport system substrate-binding protein